MHDTGELLAKLTALRQQLEQAHGLARDAGVSAATLLGTDAKESGGLWKLERQIPAGDQHLYLLDRALRQLAARTGPDHPGGPMPRQLTAQARRLLERGRRLVHQLRGIADDPLLEREAACPLAVLFQETAQIADTALRMVQAFPEAPGAQRSLCGGLEAILDVVADRVETLVAGLNRHRQEAAQCDRLAELLRDLFAGTAADIHPFLSLAEEVLADAQDGRPLRFPEPVFVAEADSPDRPPEDADVPWFVAAHSLTVAQVMARVVRLDPELRGHPLAPILAALVHDAGMLAVPAAILAHPGPLDDEQRRIVERHPRLSGELASLLLPTDAWLTEAVSMHHERLDGSGYPAGLRDIQIGPLPRLLAVCDVYSASSQPRPHRPALDSRTALTDTLLLAEKGVLDRGHAERLLSLSFYPVGSVVELADGAVGVVVATHAVRRDLSTPARPVVALFTDSEGKSLPVPQHLDLAQSENRRIVRTLSPKERRACAGSRLVAWA
jgi:hypothetical protein